MLSFGAPLFLAALGALLAPLVIHLINRERAELLRFPSVRFIPASTLPQRGRRTPKDWLLLLLRLLFFALLVMTLAQPRWSDASGALVIGDDVKPTVFVVDASASMNLDGAWESAQELVKEQARALPNGSPIGLIVFSDKVLYSTELGVGQSLSLDSIEPDQMAGQPELAIAKALSMLPGDAPSGLVVISDFQANEWSGANLRAIPETVDLRLERVIPEDASNVAILSAEAYPSPGGNLRVITRLKNFSDSRQTVTVTLNETEEQKVTIDSGGVEPVIFIVKNGGGEPGVISLLFPEDGGDAYALDDVYRFWLGAPAPIRVGTIFSEIDEPEKMNEIDFVARALEASAETGHRPFDLFVLTSDMLDNPQTRPDILYLAGSGGYLADAQLEAIKAFVVDGGSLLITPSKSASRQQRRLREAGLTEAAYIGHPGRHRDRKDTFHIGEIAEQSRLGQVFDDDTARDLFMAEIYQYVRLQPGDHARILLSEEGGDPLLFDETLGKGSVLSSAIGFDGSWSDLPLRNSFLPLLRESLADSASESEPVLRLPVGEMEGIDEPVAFWAGAQAVEINVDRRESDFTSASLADVRQAFSGSGRKISSEDSSNTFSGLELWPWFALAALLIYFIETLLAGGPERRRDTRYA